MCKWGTYEKVRVTIQPYSGYPQPWRIFWLSLKEKSFTKDIFSMSLKRYKEWKKQCSIDKCIASIVRVLEENGVRMLASCCGHGKADGHILLLDHTKLTIPMKFTSNKKLVKK